MTTPEYSSRTDAFLRKAGMHPDLIDLSLQTDIFRMELRQGLQDDASSLPMLPTYLTTEGTIPAGKPVLVIDAGGTNLRLARVVFSACDGTPDITMLASGRMPGSLHRISRKEYLAEMVKLLRPYLEEDTLIGFCFSYEAEITPDHDGILANFNKGVEIDDTDGMAVCATLEAALKEADVPGKRTWVLLNDSTAAACGALYKLSGGAYSGAIGFVLGTGTNTCYPEQTRRISRYPVSGPNRPMLINMECGAYNQFPRGEADLLLDQADKLPGNHLYEKMISGVYMGRLISLTAALAAEDGCFSAVFRERLSAAAEPFHSVDADEFVRDPQGDSRFARLCADNEDRLSLLTIIRRLYERAAKLVTVNLTAVMQEAGLGLRADQPALIAAEGSSFWKSLLFLPLLEQYMEQFTGLTQGIHYEITAVPNANLIGSAAAALLNR